MCTVARCRRHDATGNMKFVTSELIVSFFLLLDDANFLKPSAI
jgi:hypothetical protein